MTIFIFILSIFVYLIVEFVSLYCTDEVCLWKNNRPICIFEPSILDLDDVTDKYTLNNYIDTAIKKADNYFALRKNIEEIQSKRSLEGWTMAFVLRVFAYFVVVRSAANMIPMGIFDIPKIIYLIILFAITLGLCALCTYIIKQVYTARFSLGGFYLDIEELRAEFASEISEFDVDEKAAFNNYVISRHYDYLLSIKHTVQARHYTHRIFAFVAAIVYFLFLCEYQIRT